MRSALREYRCWAASLRYVLDAAGGLDVDEEPPGGVWQAVRRQAADKAALAQSQAFLRKVILGRAEDSDMGQAYPENAAAVRSETWRRQADATVLVRCLGVGMDWRVCLLMSSALCLPMCQALGGSYQGASTVGLELREDGHLYPFSLDTCAHVESNLRKDFEQPCAAASVLGAGADSARLCTARAGRVDGGVCR